MENKNSVPSNLTDRELLIAVTASIDVGPGYPQISLPLWLKEILYDIRYLDLAYSLPSKTSISETNRLHLDLLKSVCKSLDIDEAYSKNGFVTFSGSVAIDRVLASLLHAGDSILTINPSIDIVAAMVSEHENIELIHAKSDDSTFRFNIEEIEKVVRKNTKAIVITSPENPSGIIFNEEQIARLVDLAIDLGIILIFDQCFAKVNPFNMKIPLIPNHAMPNLKWILVWDTGKTFGLNEEKLGFIFCSDELRASLQERINVMQFGVSRRQKIMFKAILDTAYQENYYDYLSHIVQKNALKIIKGCETLPIRVIQPEAGSLMMLDITGVRQASNDSIFANRLLKEKEVGLIKVSAFYYSDSAGNKPKQYKDFVRIALARNPDVIDKALSKIAQFSLENS